MNWPCCNAGPSVKRGIDRDSVSGGGNVSGRHVHWCAGVFCVGVVCDWNGG